MATNDYSKQYFKSVWPEGYYEKFNYGVGIDKVCEVCLDPFFSNIKDALEIGSGGGAFTERMIGNFRYITVLDVIPLPQKFMPYHNFSYIELEDKSYNCALVGDDTKDFCFSYNLFCHLSNEAIKEYVENVHRVLRKGADFIFMIANFEHTKKHLEHDNFQLGQSTPLGHFVQDLRTIDIVVDKEKWEVVNPSMIPEHRDIIVHLKKK